MSLPFWGIEEMVLGRYWKEQLTLTSLFLLQNVQPSIFHIDFLLANLDIVLIFQMKDEWDVMTGN